MKTGRSLPDFARELQRQAQSKRDFVAPATTPVIDGDNRLNINGLIDLPASQWKVISTAK